MAVRLVTETALPPKEISARRYGVQFEGLSAEQRKKVQRFIEFQSVGMI
ncbi:MAG: hypothetical protein KAI75_10050 [Desulfobulbaceae bacterium]|nr:hypothetical protein [Desulfobulbaceae bacterium]